MLHPHLTEPLPSPSTQKTRGQLWPLTSSPDLSCGRLCLSDHRNSRSPASPPTSCPLPKWSPRDRGGERMQTFSASSNPLPPLSPQHQHKSCLPKTSEDMIVSHYPTWKLQQRHIARLSEWYPSPYNPAELQCTHHTLCTHTRGCADLHPIFPKAV